MNALRAVAAAALFVASGAAAQWERVANRNVPLGATGEPNLEAPAPRTADGKPDLSGVWLPESDLELEVSVEHMPLPRYFVNVVADLAPEDVPMQPWAAELFEERLAKGGTDSPLAYCKPTGVPMVVTAPLPYKIVQTPELIVILYEENTEFRQIFLDGRKTVEDPLPRWMGYSTGRWDGDTLIVETTGFTDQSWLDGMGHPHTDRLRVTERYRRAKVRELFVDVTIDDPGAYTAPISYTVKSNLLADEDLLEYFCTENEKDIEHYE